jgi:diphthamide biosynthesis protein 2
MTETPVRVPPQLHFDDGSRIITSQQQQSSTLQDQSCCSDMSVRGSMSIHHYYEIDRLSNAVLDLLEKRPRTKDDGWLCRIALQFPDSLLQDAADVCWALEATFNAMHEGKQPLIFILGDTTFGSCCPDEVSANHLDADVLVHFGHACLSPTMSLPVLYSFGISEIDVSACVEAVLEQAKLSGTHKILLLFQVQYHHAMQELQIALCEKGNLLVVSGVIPSHDVHRHNDGDAEPSDDHEAFIKIGGLDLPADLDISQFTALYIGDPALSKQYVNIMLRFTSMSTTSPSAIWTFRPNDSTLNTLLPTDIQRQLNRRFFLTQKARDATTFGILVGTLSQRHFASAVASLQTLIHNANRSCYTFAVGKINGAKLANFGEIDCYVLVACSETSLLDFERDLHVPVITPLELDVALGNKEWGDYTLDYVDFLANAKDRLPVHTDTDDDNDAPYFSLVKGTFEDSRKNDSSSASVNLSALPGQGQLSTYTSKGAEFLRQRQYQGLETQLGETEVHAAVLGQTGIASNYGER